MPLIGAGTPNEDVESDLASFQDLLLPVRRENLALRFAQPVVHVSDNPNRAPSRRKPSFVLSIARGFDVRPLCNALPSLWAASAPISSYRWEAAGLLFQPPRGRTMPACTLHWLSPLAQPRQAKSGTGKTLTYGAILTELVSPVTPHPQACSSAAAPHSSPRRLLPRSRTYCVRLKHRARPHSGAHPRAHARARPPDRGCDHHAPLAASPGAPAAPRGPPSPWPIHGPSTPPPLLCRLRTLPLGLRKKKPCCACRLPARPGALLRGVRRRPPLREGRPAPPGGALPDRRGDARPPPGARRLWVPAARAHPLRGAHLAPLRAGLACRPPRRDTSRAAAPLHAAGGLARCLSSRCAGETRELTGPLSCPSVISAGRTRFSMRRTASSPERGSLRTSPA